MVLRRQRLRDKLTKATVEILQEYDGLMPFVDLFYEACLRAKVDVTRYQFSHLISQAPIEKFKVRGITFYKLKKTESRGDIDGHINYSEGTIPEAEEK